MSKLLELAKRIAADVVAPMSATWERKREMADAPLREAIAAGLGSILVPVEHGGHGASVTEAAQVLEVIAGADLRFAFSLVVHNNLAASIARRGTPAQVARYLPDLIAGRKVGAFCLTEPDAGTDAAAITTLARKAANGWVLEGEKAWVSNAASAELFCVYAKTVANGDAGSIAAFLVDRDTTGLGVEAPYEMLGGHALGTSGIRLDACRVGEAALFIPPGEGFKGAMAGIDLARVLLSAMCCGALGRGLEHALDYAAGRRAFGKTLLEFQGLQWQLADVSTDLEAARLLTWHAAHAMDRGERVTVSAAHAKKFSTRAALSGLSQCMQTLGAVGFRADHPLARQFAAAKMAQYLDGATEVQNLVISRALLQAAKARRGTLGAP